MYTRNSLSQRGVILIIMAIVATIIIVAAVLVTTGVIETSRNSSESNSCEELQKRCEDSCSNEIDCKNNCFSAYQRCKKEKGS